MEKYPELINLRQIAKTLDEVGIPYYVTGGFAVSQYGRNRFTADIDIVIKMRQMEISNLVKQLQNVFPQGYIDKDLIIHALKYQSEFNLIDPESGLKIDFFVTKDNEFEKSCFKRVVKKNYDYDIGFISPEDLIISKLLWFRESESTRQLEDIASVIDIQTKIDHKYIKKWVHKLSLQEQWQDLENLQQKAQG